MIGLLLEEGEQTNVEPQQGGPRKGSRISNAEEEYGAIKKNSITIWNVLRT